MLWWEPSARLTMIAPEEGFQHGQTILTGRGAVVRPSPFTWGDPPSGQGTRNKRISPYLEPRRLVSAANCQDR